MRIDRIFESPIASLRTDEGYPSLSSADLRRCSVTETLRLLAGHFFLIVLVGGFGSKGLGSMIICFGRDTRVDLMGPTPTPIAI